MPRLQIGLPVYNGSNYLVEALDSLLAQTFTDFEILISDNGSTDATREIGEKYAADEARVRYFRYETNRGAAWNFNNVVHLADAELFEWAAHDDLREPTFLERCIEVLDTHRDVVCAYTATRSVDQDGEPTGGIYTDNCHLMEDSAASRYRRTLGLYPMHVLFGVVRRDRLVKTRLWGAFAAGDRVAVSEIALQGKIYEIPDPLFVRRWHPAVSWVHGMSDRTYAVWYDPRRGAKRLSVPKLRRGVEYAKAVRHAELSPVQAVRAYAAWARFAFWDQGAMAVLRKAGVISKG